MRFMVGVDVERTASTTVIVETEADTLEEAEHKVRNKIQTICSGTPSSRDFGIHSFSEWYDCYFSFAGINHEEEWNSGEWDSDLELIDG